MLVYQRVYRCFDHGRDQNSRPKWENRHQELCVPFMDRGSVGVYYPSHFFGRGKLLVPYFWYVFLETSLLMIFDIPFLVPIYNYCVPSIFDAKADMRPAKKTMAMWSFSLINGPNWLAGTLPETHRNHQFLPTTCVFFSGKKPFKHLSTSSGIIL